MTTIILGLAALSAIGAIVGLAIKAMSATSQAASSKVETAGVRSELAIAQASLTTQTNRADSEKARADALDDLIATTVDGPIDGAYARLLSKWSNARRSPADITSTRAMPAPSASAETKPDDLLRPGE